MSCAWLDHAQIFYAHGLIQAHRKSRVISVHMAMCTSAPIIGKHAPPLKVCDQKLGFGILLAQIQKNISLSNVVPDRVLSFFLMSFEWVVEGLLLSIVAVVRT